MAASQKASPNRFVVQAGRNEDDIRKKLAGLGEVNKLKGSDGLLVLQVDERSSAKTAWERARKLLGESGTVQPVLLDEDGSEQYPTGEITVRFNTPPSDKQLERFATSQKLRLRNRNEYMPQQAVFEPLDPGEHYIPDLVEKIGGAKEIQLAWANTVSRYKRV